MGCGCETEENSVKGDPKIFGQGDYEDGAPVSEEVSCLFWQEAVQGEVLYHSSDGVAD